MLQQPGKEDPDKTDTTTSQAAVAAHNVVEVPVVSHPVTLVSGDAPTLPSAATTGAGHGFLDSAQHKLMFCNGFGGGPWSVAN